MSSSIHTWWVTIGCQPQSIGSGGILLGPRRWSRAFAMRKSRVEAAKTRERIVAAAAAEFRRHGIAATGLADLMKAAGLTHGGFYPHFTSKGQLVAEACADALTPSELAALLPPKDAAA